MKTDAVPNNGGNKKFPGYRWRMWEKARGEEEEDRKDFRSTASSSSSSSSLGREIFLRGKKKYQSPPLHVVLHGEKGVFPLPSSR